MATVKDIASQTGYSPSTVSIVLSGKGDERKIPQSTQQKIWDVARRLNYRPNMSARLLRANEKNTLFIAVYWTLDSRSEYMIRFLVGLRKRAQKCSQKVEFIVKPYEKLADSFDSSIAYHAAIVCNASREDLDYLESLDIKMPIVLYNRYSQKYDSVEIDYQALGQLAAKFLQQQGIRKVMLLSPRNEYPVRVSMEQSFQEEAEKCGIEVWHRQVREKVEVVNAIKDLTKTRCDIKSVFCASTELSIVAMNAIFREKFQIPTDYQLLGVGSGDPGMEQYALVPITTLQIQREEMAGMCLEMVLEERGYGEHETRRKMLPPVLIRRKSC